MQYESILITGSSGVLGHGFRAVAAEYAGTRFSFTTSKDADLRDLHATQELLRTHRPNAIVHLAAVSGGVTLSRDRPATLLRDNVLMAINMLEAARLAGVGKLLMTLSVGMYPPEAALPLKEADIHRGPAHESNYSYAYAKRLIEPAVRAYRKEYGCNVIGVAPNGIFGEHDRYDASATFIAALCRRFFEGRTTQGPIVVWGDGSPLRELTYSHDMARAFLWCLEHYDAEEVLNVGTSEEHSIREIAYMIAEELEIVSGRIVFDTSKPGGILRRPMDSTRFRTMSGFEFSAFRQGLKQTLEWFKQNYHEIVARAPA